MQLHPCGTFQKSYRFIQAGHKLDNTKNRIPSQGGEYPLVPPFNKLCRTFTIGCRVEPPNYTERLSGPSFLWPIILNLHRMAFQAVKAEVQQHPKLTVSFFQEMNLNVYCSFKSSSWKLVQLLIFAS